MCQSASRVKLILGLSSTSKVEDLWTTRLGTAYCQQTTFSLIVVALCAMQNSSHLVTTVASCLSAIRTHLTASSNEASLVAQRDFGSLNDFSHQITALIRRCVYLGLDKSCYWHVQSLRLVGYEHGFVSH